MPPALTNRASFPRIASQYYSEKGGGRFLKRKGNDSVEYRW